MLRICAPNSCKANPLMEAWATCMTALSFAPFSPERSKKMRHETSASGGTDASVDATAEV